ncbi:zinc dependent phospholipase C family protein [Pseudobacteroides cellulosolvens]|uniref:Phospholipase C/P1 nuclease n=1 Tax=Pseudobacteroides cellulosolvens ATCC 35603 = DSM 2933 TaxID=398512 RepID=A0A0L6JNW1_9FIRM|nr:zinc dependent phospholipase C family protein [Pseudobacteroides cellulosolvens]KNY27057.1 phospholipase C/P1 nuclease [Pseudobacteroides cellulosolvens ATCC 35603 = DSM 2933]
MLCETHELIAKQLYKLTNTIINAPIDYKSLIFGSVAPDKNPSMVIVPHTKFHSGYLLNKNLEYFTDKKFTYNNNSINMLSYKLGIVIHLISDYFCSAHNHIKYLNPITHFLYENRLKYFFRNNIGNIEIDIKGSLVEINNNLYYYINKKHLEYLNTESSMLNDFNFTISTVSSVFVYIAYQLINIAINSNLSRLNGDVCVESCCS